MASLCLQDTNVLGGGYMYPDYARRAEWVVVQRQGQSFLEQIFPESPAWGTTPDSVGQVGSGEAATPGQDINVFGGDYVFPSYARSHRGAAFVPGSVAGQRLGVLRSERKRGQQLLSNSQLWGGQYSSVGKFPKGYNGQVSCRPFLLCCLQCWCLPISVGYQRRSAKRFKTP